MKKKYIILVMAALLPSLVFAEKVLGTLRLTTPYIDAICVYDTEAKTATLGNGYTSCINHYESSDLYIPGYVTYQAESYRVVVGQFAFRLCNKLTRVTIDEGVEHIGNYAFVGCSSLKEVTLPATLKTIGAGAFCNIGSLKSMHCKSTAAPTWQWNDVFSVLGTNKSLREKSLGRTLFIPAGCIDSYLNSKFDGTSTGTLTKANEKVGWEEAFDRIYVLSDVPYSINSLDEFKAFRDRVNNGTATAYYGTTSFRLTTDIDLSGIEWTPIGTSAQSFSGTFDGGGHVIKNLKISRWTSSPFDTDTDEANMYQGLFGKASNAQIYNMHLLNPKVSGNDYVGCLLGYATAGTHVADVLVTSNFSDPANQNTVLSAGSGGGIIGNATDGTFERCMFRGIVICHGWTGGIIGNIQNTATINDCSAAGYLRSYNSPENSVIGGIVGGANLVFVNRCFVNNNIIFPSGNNNGVGLVIGKTTGIEKSVISSSVMRYMDVNNSPIGYFWYDATVENCNRWPDDSDMKTNSRTKVCLGEDEWYYFKENYEDYPVPYTLKDMYIASCVNQTADNGLVYRPAGENQESYEVVGYTGSATELSINTYNEKPVTGILEDAFMENTTLTEITLGDNITTIGASAFKNCDALTTVNFGSSVKTIGDMAFYDCDALTNITLPNSVIEIGEDVFVDCDELTSFTIGTGFKNHTGNFLAYCPKLTSLSVADGNVNGYISVDNVLIHNHKDGNSYIVLCAPGKTGEYEMSAEGLTGDYVWIMGGCFASCEGLTGITLAPNLRYILCESIFEDCYNLRYVDMKDVYDLRDSRKQTIHHVKVDRDDTDNPFYDLSDYTMIYLPYENTAEVGEFNVVIDGKAERLALAEDWDFKPRVTPITVTDGVIFERSLEANFVEYLTDTDEDVVVDGQTVKRQDATYEYVPAGYTCYLPYPVTLTDEDVKVYKPTGSEVDEGVTTITFTEVVSKEMAAYTPYYLVVSGEDEVDLSTDDNVMVGEVADNAWAVGDFQFKGTLVEIPNTTLYDAQKPAYILQSDGKWHKVPQNQPKAYIGPFRAYFQAVNANTARALNMAFEEGEATGIDAVIRTVNSDGTEQYYDMNGRQLSSKPNKGVYIHNGKKYINK